MLPLQSTARPASAAELEAALQAGLRRQGLTPRAVEVRAFAWPAVEKLAVDLTGATATRDLRLPSETTAAGSELSVAEVAIRAEPLLLEGTALALELTARDARFRLGETLLQLEHSGPGRLSASLRQEDLRKLALEAVRAAAAPHGAKVDDLQLELNGEGDRALRFRAQVAAKMGFMKATLILTGRAELDDRMQLFLADLQLEGQGMASTLAAGFIRPQLEKLQRAPIPLSILSLGGVTLRDLKLTTGETVRAEATFSS